ncbi:MAG TPA: ABC transporter ATP-binding protein [Planctomycetota bacterium]|nr:ABC transporter ATP-binding protein [Planctomycetota bacterium]
MTESAGSSEAAVQAIGLTMEFGPVKALENVCFTVRKGEILGLLGRNGAGKTTTMRILTTYLVPTTGSARVAGFDILSDALEVRRRIGYLPETVPVYAEMEVRDYLRFVGRGRGLGGEHLQERMDWVVDKCDIRTVYRRPIGELSKGFRQRVAMAQALIHDPEILILDEPTSGLDPIQIQGVRSLVRELAATKTIIFSTHILQEIEVMTRRVIVIDGGRLVADGSVEDLIKKVGLTSRVRVLIEGSRPADVKIAETLRGVKGVRNVSLSEADRPETLAFVVTSEPGERIIPGIMADALQGSWRVVDLRVEEPRLEEAFARLVKGEKTT